MCGICGFTEKKWTLEKKAEIVREMNHLMVHRGPDDEGIHVDDMTAFGHRRLSIIDLKMGHQPMYNEDNTICIVYNGEIYNYLELRNNMISKGHKFKTNSDTETIIHLYEEYGTSCFKELNGMFAFAIKDNINKRIVLVRDRLGIKPLYYYRGSESFLFSSEIKPLMAHPDFKKEVNYQALDYYFNSRYIPAPHTIFKCLYKLKPGHYLIVNDKREVREEEYWDVPFTNKFIYHQNEIDYVYNFKEIFEESVKRRLMSDVPLGILLSGGIDSSAVLAGLAMNANTTLKTFSVGFEDSPNYSELKFAKIVSKEFNTDHHEIEINISDFIKGIEDYVRYLEEPMGDPASIPLYYVSKLASDNNIKVVLSGEGSDEILGGYNIYTVYKGYNRNKIFRKIPKFVRRKLIENLNIKYFKSAKLKQYLCAADAPINQHLLFFTHDNNTGNRFSVDEKKKLFSSSLLNNIKLQSNTEILSDLYSRVFKHDILNQILYVKMKYWLPDDLLLKADKMTMANSLELRVPFLDHTFIEYVNKLPPEMKIRKQKGSFITKYILRKAYENILPDSILNRPKMGFPVPLKSFFDGELKIRLRDYINSKKCTDAGIFDNNYIESQIQEFENYPLAKMEKALWSIYIFLEWQNQYM